MTTFTLPADTQSVNYFGACYLDAYKNNFEGLVNVVNLWRAQLYYVYVMMDAGKVLGISHGACRGQDFYGHLWFNKDCRGKLAKEATILVSETIMEDFGVSEVCSMVPPENKVARHFLTSVGFKKEGNRFSYGTTK